MPTSGRPDLQGGVALALALAFALALEAGDGGAPAWATPERAEGAGAAAAVAGTAGGPGGAAGPAARGGAPIRAASFVVVLDPGHGGSNTGCAGVVEGLYEKRFTLALARAVARRLAREDGISVVLTRSGDEYVSLRERVRRANRAGADVLVSIHANASPSRGQRGYETFVLRPETLEVDAWALRSDDGPARPGVDPATAEILDDVERGTAMPWAVRLAERLQVRLQEVRGPLGNRGVRQGSQDVLIGPTIPAVLVEVGFFDHPIEGVELLRRSVREALADAIAAAILDYRALRGADPR